MKKFLRFSWLAFCVGLLAVYMVSCCSAYVSATTFRFMPLFALAFPYLFLATIVTAFCNLFSRKKLAFIMLGCALLPGYRNVAATVAFRLPQPMPAKKDSATLRLVTWNVQDFVDFMNHPETAIQMLQLIANSNADIVCVQEFTNIEGSSRYFSIRQKMDSLGFKHYFNSKDVVNPFKGGYFMRGSAVFSRLPFTSTGRFTISNREMEENCIYVDVDFGNKPLRVYTAHLQSFALYTDTSHIDKDVYEITYNRKRTIQHKLREIEAFHEEEATTIRTAMAKATVPAVYCGDMNTVPSSYTYRVLKNDLQDAFLEKGAGIGATFYKVLPMLRIDYCFADKRLSVTGCKVLQQRLADHYPLVTDLRWK